MSGTRLVAALLLLAAAALCGCDPSDAPPGYEPAAPVTGPAPQPPEEVP